ncbi:MAG: spore coat protein [Ruminococcaceae bacterium]|nr:spore coat protein [Oscillospiraceae bacterium]MBO4972558.1 spore coat protein [Clostridia bacterium]
MTDREIMENILNVTKGACDLMMHGAIESSTQDVHETFTKVFNDTLCMQNAIYAKMADKGWYPMTKAEQQKIDAVKQKFSEA